MKKKKKVLNIIGILVLIISVFGVSIAFFNYTRTGNANTVRVGRISFNSSQTTMVLTNVFPISSSYVGTDEDNVITATVTVDGDTNYSDGIEYLITTTDVHNMVSNKTVPISLIVTVGNGLGTSDDSYYTIRDSTNASIYKIEAGNTVEENSHIIVGYIAPDNNQTGVNGTITIKAYIDMSKVAIADTYDGTESDNMGTTNNWVNDRITFTTTEWNSLSSNPLSFKIKVEANEGIWVEEPLTAFTQITRDVNTTTQINFGNISSASNGQGLYILPGTTSDTYPIYYYRGAIDNNNVLFGGFCWQIVRTTDTGGIKMIYNGLPDITGSGDNITYNCGSTRDIQNTVMSTVDLKKTSPGYYYADDYEIVSTNGNSAIYRLKSAVNPITPVAIANASAASTNIPTIAANYPYTCRNTTDTGTCTILYRIDSYASGTNANVYASNDISTIGIGAFNSQYQSVADAGYMKNVRYAYVSDTPASGVYFGTSVEYGEYDTNNPGTNVYRLVDGGNGSVDIGIDATRHYTCNETTANGTCMQVRYYYYDANSRHYYINLTGGETVEDALYKMTGNGTDIVKQRNSGYVLNQNNSTAKTNIENWFKTNLTNEVDSTKENYVNYLEDTIWCNDRSYKTVSGDTNYSTYLESGWNPNGGALDKTLYFGKYNRYYNNWYSTINVPTIACPNETDRFSMSSSVAHLNYPVGLLTADEVVLAGMPDGASNSSYYLYIGAQYWTMSPALFKGTSSYDGSYETRVDSVGGLSDYHVNKSASLRPVVSLKSGTEFETGGNGTPTNPYVVKYN